MVWRNLEKSMVHVALGETGADGILRRPAGVASASRCSGRGHHHGVECHGGHALTLHRLRTNGRISLVTAPAIPYMVVCAGALCQGAASLPTEEK